MRKILVLSVVVAACGGGGSEEDPDANPPDAMIEIDAAPVEQLEATLGGILVCEEGWTTHLEALDEEPQSRIVVRGSCSSTLNEVELIFKPRPTGPGTTAPIHQTTFQIEGGQLAICIVDNAVRFPPVGQLTLSDSSPPRVTGSCSCEANDDPTAIGIASFALTLE